MELAVWRKSWAIALLAVGLALCLTGCETLFPKPVYVPPPAAAPPPPPRAQIPRATLYVAVNRLNLRACPGMDCPKITVIERNEAVEKIGSAGDWSQIRIKRNGTIGWVSSRYLSATPATPPPEVAAPPAVKPPPLPPQPELGQPVPAVEKARPATPPEVAVPTIKRKPEEARPAAPAKAAKPAAKEATSARKPVTAPEQPSIPAVPVKPAKPAPAPAKPAPPPAQKQAPPAAPSPEQPSTIRIM